jgi:hypothetical protein
MTIGAAIFLVALGAILRYAVSDSIEGINLETIGLILMIAGVAGVILEFVRQGMWRRDRADEPVARDRPPRDRY